MLDIVNNICSEKIYFLVIYPDPEPRDSNSAANEIDSVYGCMVALAAT